MASGLERDDVALVGRQMAEHLVETESWLREWGFLPVRMRAGEVTERHGEPDAADVLIDDSRYRIPNMETLIVNACRVRAARQALLDTGSLSAKELAGVRGCSAGTLHKQIQRSAKRGELFTVTVAGELRIPAVLLDEAADFRADWKPVISELCDAGMSSWSIWGWIAEPNAGLSGEIAAEVIETDPERVLSAARRSAIQELA